MTYMKILLLLMFCTVLPMQAQQMKKLTDLKDFEARLLQEAKNIESIESNFTQIKYLDVFDEKITSKGTFYYKKSNKICMDYAQPMNYLIVINNNQLKIVSDGKKSIMDLHSNKMMNQMQDMLTACMVGDLSNMSPGYALEYFEDAHYYLIQIKPVSKAIQAYINQIQIYLDKKDMSVHKLRLSETATNYTEYEFSDKKFNSLNDEASLRYASWLLLLFILLSCSHRVTGEATALLPSCRQKHSRKSTTCNWIS